MLTGIIGKKIGMTQVFVESGRGEPVTAIQAGPCIVTQVKTQFKDGYQSIQLGFGEPKRLIKPLQGHLKRSGGKLLRHLREFRQEDVPDLQVGQKIDVSIFKPGDRVNVVGISRGKGMAGGVKRHHFRGGPKTHGQKDRHRGPGSIGAGTFPGRVFKGTRMGGHMGAERVTVRNLEVVQADSEKNLLLLKGAVPGAPNGLLLIRLVEKGGS